MNIVSDILDETPESLTEAEELDKLIKALDTSKDEPQTKPITLNPYQSQFLLAPDLGKGEVLYSGSVGGGKTLTLCLALLRYIAVPNTTVILCRKTLQDLKKSTLQSLLKPEPQLDGSLRPPLLPLSCIKTWNKTDGIIGLHNDSSIIVLGAQDPEKIRSVNASAGFIEEASEFTEEMYTAVLQRCRLPNRLGNTVFSCTNPKSKRHFLYNRFFVDKDNTRMALTVNAYSNPHLSKAYVRQLEKLPTKERQRMLLGEWTSDDQQVFSSFDAMKHVKVCPVITGNTYSQLLLSQDYGGGSGGSAMHLLGVIGDTVYCLREFYRIGPSHSMVLDWMEQYRQLAHSRIVYDSANAALKLDMDNRGWTCIPCIKDIEGSVSLVNSRFHDNKLIIDPQCTMLIKQLEEAGRDSNGIITKIRGWDAIDSYRYGVVALARKEEPVKRVLSGMSVRRR